MPAVTEYILDPITAVVLAVMVKDYILVDVTDQTRAYFSSVSANKNNIVVFLVIFVKLYSF